MRVSIRWAPEWSCQLLMKSRLRQDAQHLRSGVAFGVALRSARCFLGTGSGDDRSGRREDAADHSQRVIKHVASPVAADASSAATVAKGAVRSDGERVDGSFQGWRRVGAPTASGSISDQSDRADVPKEAGPPVQSSFEKVNQNLSKSSSPSSALSDPSKISTNAAIESRARAQEAQRRVASARLATMFTESAHHTEWLQEQHQRTGQNQEYQEDALEARLVRTPHASTGQGKSPYSFDEDDDDDGAAERMTGDATAAETALLPTGTADLLEQELLDDNALYYPPQTSVRASADEAAAPHLLPKVAPEPYVPGQQIVPPGLTRYRVDVQYQGVDFNGWYKSVQRVRPAQSTPSSQSAARLSDSAAGSRHFARTVLEEALAVAFDVASVDVVAAVIPETGVSVRRLTCHLDVPSEVELQPRTILQRATLWLHQRQQPLAILSCHPCRNQDFHARHSGVRRVYCYRILNRIAPPLFDAGFQWHIDRYLDVPRMQRMAKLMEGTHDYGFFADPKMANALRRAASTGAPTHGSRRGVPIVSSAYSAEHEPLTSHGLASGETPAAPKVKVERGLSQLERAAALPTFNTYGQRITSYESKPQEYYKAHTNLPTVRTIDKIEVVRQEDEVLLWFVGQSFLRHQIRNMVSVLKAGGHGLWDAQELQHAFQAGFEVSRKRFKLQRLSPAPVYGLTLWDVEYPQQHNSDYVPYVDAGPYEPFVISSQL